MARTSDRDRLDRLSQTPFTYPGVGATSGEAMPDGYQTLERSATLGQGAETFERAAAGLMSWQMHRRAGFAVAASAPEAGAGVVVILTLGRRPLAVTAPCRVVSTTIYPRCRGFSYGTLAGRPETGEESFLVRHEDDDRVTFTVRAFSRPATLLARAGGPLTRLVQDLLTRRYLGALGAIASATT